MTITEHVIVAIAERFLHRPTLKNHPLYPVYTKYLPLLDTVYSEVGYWHGTGHYHYRLLGQSKYEGVDFNQTYNVLAAIIGTGGIMPKYDPVVGINGEYRSTISLTAYRMYARAYAEFNQFAQNDFEYVFGTTKFWFYFLASLQIIEHRPLHNIKSVFKSTRDKKFVQKTQPWTDTLRKRNKNEIWTAVNFYKVRSDIPNNYGLLFGIKKHGINPVPFNKTIERFETRTSNTILLSDATHLEVTMKKVAQVEQELRDNKISVPVIPIEIGELYCSQKSLTELSGIKL